MNTSTTISGAFTRILWKRKTEKEKGKSCSFSTGKICCVLLILAALFLGGCGGLSVNGDLSGIGKPDEKKENSEILLPVVLVDGDHYTAKEPFVQAAYGDSVTLTLEYEKGFTFDSCSYPDYQAEQIDGHILALTLNHLIYPARVEIQSRESGYGIDYQLNGGVFRENGPLLEELMAALGRTGEKTEELEEEEAGSAAENDTKTRAFNGEESEGETEETPPADHYFIWHEVGPHLRPNTSIGTDMILREGYTQTGWNTKADGSGEHIGLGSRVTVEEGTAITLYAEWEKWLPEADFAWEETENGTLRLTAYTGPKDADPFVIPARIGGVFVTELAEGFAEDLTGETLVLPPSLYGIDEGAMKNCAFTSAYFYDNIERVTNESFEAPFHTLHLNAIRPPKYITNDNAQFAENAEKLMMAPDDRKKMVFFAGCSFSYGLVSEDIAAVYGSEYDIYDLGVIGGGNAPIQYDVYRQYLKEGDIFVHAPEASQHQLMSSYGCDFRLFVMTEGNYDLLSETDAAYLENFWNSLQELNESRDKLQRKLSYLDITPHYNSYGDIKIPRMYTNQQGVSFSDYSYFYRSNSVTQEAAERMCDWYQKLTDQGVTVLFSFSPMNRDGLDTDGKKNSPFYFESFISDILKRHGIPVISEMKNYVMGSEYFYDSDYHMNEVGASRRTAQLIKDLEGYVPVPSSKDMGV